MVYCAMHLHLPTLYRFLYMALKSVLCFLSEVQSDSSVRHWSPLVYIVAYFVFRQFVELFPFLHFIFTFWIKPNLDPENLTGQTKSVCTVVVVVVFVGLLVALQRCS